jgi:hypothetical protein
MCKEQYGLYNHILAYSETFLSSTDSVFCCVGMKKRLVHLIAEITGLEIKLKKIRLRGSTFNYYSRQQFGLKLVNFDI